MREGEIVIIGGPARAFAAIKVKRLGSEK